MENKNTIFRKLACSIFLWFFLIPIVSAEICGGSATFNWSNNGGSFTIGPASDNSLVFNTRWSERDGNSLWAYGDIRHVFDVSKVSDISSASQYDSSSENRGIYENEFVVYRNTSNFYAVIKLVEVNSRVRGDEADTVTIEYYIQTDGTDDFSSAPDSLSELPECTGKLSEAFTFGIIFLQTSSTSRNISYTHILNTSDERQQFVGTLYGSDGIQIGAADQPLHADKVMAKGRLVISSKDIEEAFNIEPWSGPAMLEVKGTGSFELMTKLTSPSGLISNTNCVRQKRVHNIGGFDQTDMTYVRFINIGNESIASIRGSLYDDNGNIVGDVDPVLVDELPAKSHVWRNRNQLSDIVGDTWNDTASLEINNPDSNLRLINLNFINSETFFNFSCYETGQ